MELEDIAIEEEQRPNKALSELSPKHQKIIELSEKKVMSTDIAKVVNMHPDSVSRVRSGLSKYSISSDKKLLKKCLQAAHMIIDGFKSGDRRIKASDVNKLIEMQQARIDPAIQKTESKNLNLQVVVTPEERSEILIRLTETREYFGTCG